MKNYADSDYALNKYSDGIVYRFANEIVEITLADYLMENPEKKPEDFAKLKAFSDADYKNCDRHYYRQTWRSKSYGILEGIGSCYFSSPEELLISKIDAQEVEEAFEKHIILAKQALGELTKVQRERYLLYVVGGLSTRQIAEKEGKNHKSVYESLQAAERKIKKFLKSN